MIADKAMREHKTNGLYLPVKIGIGVLDHPMTRKQAKAYAAKNIPSDLLKAGFVPSVVDCRHDVMDTYPSWYRINYSK